MKKLLLFLLLLSTTFTFADALQQGSVIIRSISVASAGATTSLTFTSKNYTVVTGVLTENIELPDATTLVKDRVFTVANRSTGAVTVKDDGGTTLKVLASGEDGNFKILDISTSDGNWLIIKTGDFLADGSVPLTGPLDVGNNPMINASTWGLDNGSDRAYTMGTIYTITASLRSDTGSSFFNLQSAPDDGSVSVGFSISAKTGNISGPIEALNIFYLAGPKVYRFQSFNQNGGISLPIEFDTDNDNVPEVILKTNGDTSFENNRVINVGEFATSEQLVALTADDQSVTATRSMMRVTSDNVTSTNRTMDLQDGTNNGQRLTIISDTPVNAWELQVTANQCLTALFTSTDNGAINLIWNSTTACWHEPR